MEIGVPTAFQDAVDDLLKHIITPGSSLNRGETLFNDLLSRSTQVNNPLPVDRVSGLLKGIVRKNLEARYDAVKGIAIKPLHLADKAGMVECLRDYIRPKPNLKKSTRFLRWLLPVYMCYFDGWDRLSLAHSCDVASRTMDGYLSRGRRMLAEELIREYPDLLALPEFNTSSTVEAASDVTTVVLPTDEDEEEEDGSDEEAGNDVPPASSTNGQHPTDDPRPSPEPTAPQPGRSVQTQPPEDGHDRLVNALGLLAIVVSFTVIMLWPWVGIGVSLPLIVWRTFMNSRHVFAFWKRHKLGDEGDDHWWYVMYLIPWLWLLGLGIYVAATLPNSLATPAFTWSRFIFTMRSLILATGLLLLGIGDAYWAIHWHSGPHTFAWLWRRWKDHADHAWDNRWPALQLAWLLMTLVSVAMFALYLAETI